MNKEEILAKSRAENNDEGLKNVENRGRKIGFIAYSCVFLFLTLFNYVSGRDNYIANALFTAFVAGESYPMYTFTKKKKYLILVMIGAFASFLSLLSYIESVLR